MTKFYYEKMRLSKLHVCMKSFVLLLFSIFGMTLSQAQVSSYLFSQSNGSYTEITGGTVLATATGNAIGAPSLDSGVFPVTLPFPFTFNNQSYNDISVSVNGYIVFGGTAPTSSTPISGTTVYDGAVAAFGRDINSVFDIAGKTGSLSWEVSGTAPNRVATIQWKEFRPTYTTSTTSAYTFNFQIKLFETSNVIQTVYSAGGYLIGSTAYSATNAQIGLRGATNADFNNRVNAATALFTSSTAGTANNSSQSFNTTVSPPGMPTEGLIYTWTPPTCYGPNAPFNYTATTNTATFSWTAANPAPALGYEVYYSTTNVAPDSSTILDATNSVSTVAGDTDADIAGLTPATTYYVWVRSKCSTTDHSSWTPASTFITDCIAITSMFEDFESYATGSIVPTCWARIEGTGSQTITTTTPASGVRNIYQYATATQTPDIVVLPTFSNINSGTHRLRFKARVTTTPGSLDVGYVTNISDASTFTVIQNLTITNTAYTTSDAEYIVYVPTTVPANARLAIRNGLDSKSYYWDDVYWETAPTCVEPSNLVPTIQTVNSGTVQWDAPAISTPVSYTVYYSTSATAPDASTVLDATNSVTVPSTSLSATINGLASATMYYAWIRTNCAGSDVSGWSSSVFFVTLCNPFTVPYSENFDTTSVGSSSNNNAPTCWKYLEPSGWGGYGYVSSSTGQFSSAPNGYYIYSSDAAGGGMLVSPPTSNLMNGLNRVRFKANAGGANYNVQVGTLSNPNDPTTFTSLATIALGATNVWGDYTVYIPTGTDQYFAFKHPGQTGTGTSVRFDDIFFEVAPTCVEPSNFAISGQSANSISMQWTPPAVSTPTSYTIYYSTTNVAPDGSTVLDGTNSLTVSANAGNMATVGSLNPSSTYYFWIRSNCSGSDFSIWTSTSISGYTGYCIPSTGATTTRWLETVTTTGGMTNLNYSNATYIAYDDQSSTTFSTYPSGTIDYSMDASTTSNTYYYIWVDWNNDMDFDDAGEKVLGTASVANATGALTVPSTTPLGSYRVRLAAATVSTIGPCGTPANGNYVDFTLNVVAPSGCLPPSNLSATNETYNSALVSWNASVTPPANGYEVYYSTSSTPPTASTVLNTTNSVTGIPTTTYSTTINNLTPSTSYFFWVRSVCSASSSSDWTSSNGTFTTPCQPPLITGTMGATVCPNNAATLSATADAGATINWYDVANGGTPVGNGNSFTTPSLTTTTDYYVSASAVGGTESVGVANPSVLTNGGTTTAGTTFYMEATISNSPVTIHSVDVFPNAAGNQSFIRVYLGTSTTSIYEIPFTSNVASGGTIAQTVPLNITLSPGVYRFKIEGAGSYYRNYSTPGGVGQAFPYGQGNFKLTGGSNVTTGYYLFYNFVVNSICESARTMVTATVDSACMGTTEVENTKMVKIYPNPFTDFITISDARDVTKVTVIDVSGRLVRMVDNPSSKINLSELKSGMYILKVDYKDGSSKSAKVIKK